MYLFRLMYLFCICTCHKLITVWSLCDNRFEALLLETTSFNKYAIEMMNPNSLSKNMQDNAGEKLSTVIKIYFRINKSSSKQNGSFSWKDTKNQKRKPKTITLSKKVNIVRSIAKWKLIKIQSKVHTTIRVKTKYLIIIRTPIKPGIYISSLLLIKVSLFIYGLCEMSCNLLIWNLFHLSEVTLSV